MQDLVTVEITFEAMGESVVEGVVLEWLKEEGDSVKIGETLVEVTTDKIDFEIPSTVTGTLLHIYAHAGEKVKINDLLANIQVGDAPLKNQTSSPKVAVSSPNIVDNIDVLDEESKTQGSGDISELRGAENKLAYNMEQSLSIPTATSFRTISAAQLDARRSELNKAGQNISFAHLISWAVVRTAADLMPVMTNHFARFEGKSMLVSDGVINLAVDIEKNDVSTPVIKNASEMDFVTFIEAFDKLLDKDYHAQLKADDFVGANMTVTNPGLTGTSALVPRLMPNQGTIIALGSINYPVGLAVIADAISAEKIMTITSTYDHRVIQGSQSGRFLEAIEAQLNGEYKFYEQIFESLGLTLGSILPAPPTLISDDFELMQAVQAATELIEAFRTHGHLAAELDPLGTQPIGDPALDYQSLGLSDALMRRIPSKLLQIYVPGDNLAESLPYLRDVYTGTIAYESEHITSHRKRNWLREQIEGGVFSKPPTPESKRALLRRLLAVDALERFMHKAYLGQQQFSIEGLDMTVPMIDEAVRLANAVGTSEVVIGMAHRGRLNVLAHNLGRSYETILGEFEGNSTVNTVKAVTEIPQGGTGDVKYHYGHRRELTLEDGNSILITLESNPSHLEVVNPVVMGVTRAMQTNCRGPMLELDPVRAMSIVLHGDAAMPGQGVVAETFNLRNLEGYKVGGTLHIIQNNQVGFTTDIKEARSTLWASDLAKGFDVPIIHVNSDDVEACISAVNLAMAFRTEFGHDILIDLIGYRRFGHNEADEPSYTQPDMYAKIRNHDRVCTLYADKLLAAGIVTRAEVEIWQQQIWDDLSRDHQNLKEKVDEAAASNNPEQITGEFLLDHTKSPKINTTVAKESLRLLIDQLQTVPEGFSPHKKLSRQLERRRTAIDQDGTLDWATAESLALGSLLLEGTAVRLTGQDCERGTFSQRHLIFHDEITNQTYSPIQNLPEAGAPIEIYNSPLSETSCLGFEYGYAQESSDTLVLWEAQYGDFANAGQIIIDQFIASGLAKWGKSSRLTLLLPHGYEGQGPEHSSARLERFLQLCAEGNMCVANVTTPAQYFHLLRRQAMIAVLRPLVIMTPKSLLRLPQATSNINQLSEGGFDSVLFDSNISDDKITRLLLCTGKIYYDLAGHNGDKSNEKNASIAIGRVEQLYPFPESDLRDLIARYPNLKEIVWVQEEPRNMGAYEFMFERLLQIIPEGLELSYIGRSGRASPGEGYPAAHNAEQQRIITSALDLALTSSLS